MDLVCKRVQVGGRVTGVGFRFSTIREVARYPGIDGYVRNMDSHTVECVLQGPAAEVNAMVLWLRQGPVGSRVEKTTVDDLPLQDFHGTFEIRY